MNLLSLSPWRAHRPLKISEVFTPLSRPRISLLCSSPSQETILLPTYSDQKVHFPISQNRVASSSRLHLKSDRLSPPPSTHHLSFPHQTFCRKLRTCSVRALLRPEASVIFETADLIIHDVAYSPRRPSANVSWPLPSSTLRVTASPPPSSSLRSSIPLRAFVHAVPQLVMLFLSTPCLDNAYSSLDLS